MKKLRSILAITVLGVSFFALLPNKMISALSWSGIKGKVTTLKEGVKTEAKKVKLRGELFLVQRELQKQRSEFAKARNLEATKLEFVPARDVRSMAKGYASLLELQIQEFERLETEINDALGGK